jgi:hypothetical protein
VKASVHPDELAIIVGSAELVAAPRVEVGSAHVEADIPARAVSIDGSGQDLGTRRDDQLPGVWIDVLDRAQQSPQPAGLVMDAYHADGR